MANGFTDLLDTGFQGQPILADAQDLFGLIFLLIAALVGWINKRKDASKLEQASHAVPTQRSPPHAPAQAGTPTGWLARLEQLAEAQLPKTDQELERHYDDNYELESVETPMIIPADELPPVIGTTVRQTRRTRETPNRSATLQASSNARQPNTSPVYKTTTYTTL